MKNLEKELQNLFDQKAISNAFIRVGRYDDVLLEYSKSTNLALDEYTLFDMASVSKLFSVTQISLIALDRKMLALDDKVSKFYDCDEELEIRHLLTHTWGIGHKNLCQENNTYDNIGEYIVSIPKDFPIGSRVKYSCPGFILLGKILEKVYGDRLDVLFQKYVATPLGLTKTTYCPDVKSNTVVNANDTEEERGIVNDYNCRFLGGIAGNAGLFSCAADLQRLCQALLHYGEGLYSKETFLMAAQNYTPEMTESRGLGCVYVDSKYIRTGDLFPEGSIGHGGHTGQLLYVDYKTGLYAIILTDLTKHNKNFKEIKYLLRGISNAIKKDIEAEKTAE